jgi:excinuclease ABC subunit A
LRDLGNTVIVVEHDRDTIERSDFVIDLGPGAGRHGGDIVAQGPRQRSLPMTKVSPVFISRAKGKYRRAVKLAKATARLLALKEPPVTI